MKYQQWKIAQQSQQVCREMERQGVPLLVAATLCARGLTDLDEAKALLSSAEDQLCDPYLMKDMDLATARIGRALRNKESIAVYGDYDVDGITATCLLTHYLRSQGGNVRYYIPDRLTEGYGVNNQAVEELALQGVTLIITVDCGITALAETAYAASLGVDMIVTDHHECKEKLPDAIAVVDPHRKDCPYPFKDLAGVGVALKLVMALGSVSGGEKRANALFHEYADLAAVGTIADVMKLLGENRTIVRVGLKHLKKTRRRGLYALMVEAGTLSRAINSTTVGYCLSPRINAAGRMGAADKAADLLLCQDPAEAARLARELCALNRERQAVEQTIYAQAVEQIDHLPPQERSALVLASDTWHQGVVGIVASRLSEKYACPSFMIHLSGTVGKGSCRSWGGFNLFAALERCSDLLLDFGGHELAAGFTIDVANIPAFRQRMNQLVREYQGGGAPEVCLEIDAALTCPSRVTLTEVEALGMLEPYGAGNNRPLFCLMGATLERLQSVGQNRHLKLRLSKGSSQFDGIFFSVSPDTCPVAAGSRVDAAFYLQINEFRGNRTVQLQMVDIRPSLTVSTREDECLHLLERCLRGDRLLPKEAIHLLPSRSQCVQLWRALEHTVPPEGLTACYLPLLRELSARLEGADPFLRTAFCLEVFRERQLLTLRQEGDTISITLTGQGKHVRLEESGYLQGLHEVMQPKRGGDHHD